MSSRKPVQSLVALGLLTVHYGFPSLGVCPISVPVLLPAEGAADQFPTILRIQPHLRFLLEPPGRDLGGRGKGQKPQSLGRASK